MTGYESVRMIGIRRRIINRVGTKDSGVSPLQKQTLNSLAAYLTGELPCDPDDLYDYDDPSNVFLSKEEVRDRVIEAVDGLEPRDGADYFRRDDLVTIIEAMDERGDQREWAGGPSELGEQTVDS